MLTDPQGWGSGSNLVQAGFINEPHTEDHIGRLKLSATRYFESGPFSGLEFGADYEHRRKDYVINQDFLVLGGGPSLLLNGGATQTAPIPASALEGTGDPLGFMGIGPEPLYNPFALIESGTLVEYPTALSSISVPPDWVVFENDTTPYVQLDHPYRSESRSSACAATSACRWPIRISPPTASAWRPARPPADRRPSSCCRCPAARATLGICPA